MLASYGGSVYIFARRFVGLNALHGAPRHPSCAPAEQISQIREMPQGAAEIVTTLIPVAKVKDIVARLKDQEDTDGKVLFVGEGTLLSCVVQGRGRAGEAPDLPLLRLGALSCAFFALNHQAEGSPVDLASVCSTHP